MKVNEILLKCKFFSQEIVMSYGIAENEFLSYESHVTPVQSGVLKPPESYTLCCTGVS